ncbi:glutaminase family protein [Dysgonomonas hofstadii]|nr:glutaminase family protein [Dysgonomonas hofstadii]
MVALCSIAIIPGTAQQNNLRAPAYPLITIDPYTSCWSAGNYLYDQQTTHWSGNSFPLVGAIRVDGQTYRFMGIDSPTGTYEGELGSERYLSVPATQLSADVQATRTIYTFRCGTVELTVTFAAPLFLNNLELISRPVNYISYQTKSLDKKKHDVQIYFEASPACAIHTDDQFTVSNGFRKDKLMFVRTGAENQKVLGRHGDQIKIDWGYFYLCTEDNGSSQSVGNVMSLRRDFATNGKLNGNINESKNSNIAISRDLGLSADTQGMIMAGFDDIYSIQYFNKNLRPYWNRKENSSIEVQFALASKEYTSLIKQCANFDEELMKSATRVGGVKYAELCAMAYRQAVSAHKLVEAPNGDLMFFSKENASNGSIGTVDITYPSSPLFLYYNPELAKALMNHIFYYSESGKWKKNFPAHDVGTYPKANGQTYKHDMPVEESGNMLILTAAIASVEGNAEYARKHWDSLTTWAEYLVENGLDPDDQLCTDDFAGKSAHNANLSIKAIMGIASFSYCAQMLGKEKEAGKFLATAKQMAQEWIKKADDGDHYRLNFDKPGTWSQKYNLVWNKILDFGVFPSSVYQKEITYYLTKQNKYGLPLDSRRLWTKSDWIMWSATLADNKETFGEFINPVWNFMNETVLRVPMSDWYKTDVPAHVIFKGRSVVGAYWIKMLEEKLNANK